MRIALATLTSALALVAGAKVVSADVFDTAPTSDNSSGTTRNELIHGSDQLHDLAALPGPVQDNDWYRISQKPYASYEVVVETTSSAIGPTLAVDLIASDGSTILASSVGISSLGFSRSLRWHNGGTLTPPTSPIDNQFIRVRSGQCTTGCTSNDVYRIRVYETTQFGARFNNSGTQETYYFFQNSSDYTIQVRVYFWSSTGTLLCQSPLVNIPPRAEGIVDDDTFFQRWTGASDVPLCADGGDIEDEAGHLTLVNNGRFGDLRSQGSALDPFGLQLEFDTEMPTRPR